MLQTHRVRTLDQVRSFLDGAEPVEVRPLDRSARYEFVARTLRRFGYWQPGKADKGVARRTSHRNVPSTGSSRKLKNCPLINQLKFVTPRELRVETETI